MRTLALASLLTASLAACGGGHNGGGGPLGDDDTSGDDAPNVDGGHTASGKVGSIWVSSYSYTYPQTGTFAGTSLSAQFYPQAPSAWESPNSGCYTTMYGTNQNAQASAGTVRFGTSPPTTLTPTANGTYMAAMMDHALAANTMISVDVTGATVPAFTASATVPATATLTAPAVVDSKVTINRATDLVVKWTGGSGDISVQVGEAGGGSFVNCIFAASAHQGTVPASLMMELSPGVGSFGASIRTMTEKDVGDWSVYIGATSSVNTSSGASAGASATLQ